MFSLMNVSEITQTFGLFLTGGYGPFLSFCSWINRTCWLKKSWQGNQKLKITFLNTRITPYLRMVSFFTTSGLWLTGIAQSTAPHSVSVTHTHKFTVTQLFHMKCCYRNVQGKAACSTLCCPGCWVCDQVSVTPVLYQADCLPNTSSLSSKRSKTCTLRPLASVSAKWHFPCHRARGDLSEKAYILHSPSTAA